MKPVDASSIFVVLPMCQVGSSAQFFGSQDSFHPLEGFDNCRYQIS
jgi:hypothetical protein